MNHWFVIGILVFFALLSGRNVVQYARSGEALGYSRFGMPPKVRKQDDPGKYWMLIIFNGAFAVILALGAAMLVAIRLFSRT